MWEGMVAESDCRCYKWVWMIQEGAGVGRCRSVQLMQKCADGDGCVRWVPLVQKDTAYVKECRWYRKAYVM